MANQRKLGRTADQRKALLRNQVTNLIWYGRIETTISKAKEVRRIADRMITLAVRECDNTVSTTKETHNDKGQLVTLDWRQIPISDIGHQVTNSQSAAVRTPCVAFSWQGVLIRLK